MIRRASTALAAVALVAGVWALLHVGWYTHGEITDFGVYETYGSFVVDHHAVPYRDFTLEYPPAALPMFVLPAWLPGDYREWFQGLLVLCHLAIVLAALRLGGVRAALVTAVAPLALGSVVVSRFDLWPAALVACALAALLSRRFAISAALLGTAFAAKLWPAVLVPFVIVWLARNHGRRAAALWTATAALVAAVWFIPFAIVSPGGVGHSFHQQFARPLQIESLGGALLIAVHHVAGTSLHVVSSFGSQNLAGPGAHAVAVLTSAAEVLVLGAVLLLFARGRAGDDELLASSAAAVAVLIGLGKVFSPQFVIWLVPLVPVVRGRRWNVAVPLFLGVLVLTQLWFPSHYWDYAQRFAGAQSVEVLVRDVGVLLLAVVLAWPRLEHEVLGEHRARVEALERVRAQVE